MEKYFKIGEISKLYHIGVDSLRYYEEIGLISPKRSDAGYRLYSINDIWRLNVIRDLLELGFRTEVIRQYLDQHTTDSTLALLQEEQDAIDRKMQTLQTLRRNVQHRMQTIRSARSAPIGSITMSQYPQRSYFSIPQGYSQQEEMDVLIKELLNIDPKHFYIIGSNQIGTVISLNDACTLDKIHYQSVFLIADGGDAYLKAGTYLSVCYQGDYGQCHRMVRKLLSYAGAHGLTPVDDILELLWIDNHTTSDISEQITELQVRVEPAAAP